MSVKKTVPVIVNVGAMGAKMSEVNGLKTAVKAGAVTPKQALEQIAEWNKKTPWLSPTRTIGWLKRYKPRDTDSE